MSAQPNGGWRPHAHFTPPASRVNDPTGLVYIRGEYHLFYQFIPFEAAH
jgi:fructan beta-fructosidase